MKRKIIKLAEKTLVVSLPSAWIQSMGLEKGDELDVLVDGNNLQLATVTKQEKSSVILDISQVTERVLRWKISSYHKQGYDEIIIINFTDEQYTVIEELTRTLFVGFLIKERTQVRVIIGQVASTDITEFDGTLRRGFRHLVQMAMELLQAFEEKDAHMLARQISHEQNNNQITNFCERLLNKYLVNKENGHFWYVVAWNLEKVADSLKYIAQHYADNVVVSGDALVLYKKLLVYLEGYSQLLYSFSFSSLVELNEQKKTLEKELVNHLLNGEQGDRVFVHYLHQLVLQLADFSASIIALQSE